MTMLSGFDARVGLLAQRQAGALARRQAHAIGANDPMIARRVRSGRWHRRYPGVYVVGGAPRSYLQDVWCALLAIGPNGTVTHETALRLRGLERVAARPLTFTVPHGGHARVSGALVHQLDDLRPHHVGALHGLPVSQIERALVDVAATVGERRLADLVDDAVSARLTGYPHVGACLREVVRPGKPGVAKLGRVLDDRTDGPVPSASDLERALFGAMAAGGLPPPKRQMPLPGRGAIDGLVDAGYRDARLIVEADGRKWHTRIRDLKRDHQRDAEAARVGWMTLRFMYEQIVHDPAEVCATIVDVRATRLVGAGSADGAPVARPLPLAAPEAIANDGRRPRHRRTSTDSYRLGL